METINLNDESKEDPAAPKIEDNKPAPTKDGMTIDVSSSSAKSGNPFWHPPSSPRHFDKDETRNVAIFIVGIMLFKFAFESLNNCVALFAANRFNEGHATTMLATLTAVFAVIQAISSIAVAQLMTRFTTNRILACSLWIFGGLAALIIIIEAASGGTLQKPGTWTPYGIFPIYISMGGCLGVLELIRRTIPRDIVGHSSAKLQRMDATVHIFYEVAGTAGAFASTALISGLGYVYGLILLPAFFFCSGIAYSMLRLKHLTDLQHEAETIQQEEGAAAAAAGSDVEMVRTPSIQALGQLGTLGTEGGAIRTPSDVEYMMERERLDREIALAEGSLIESKHGGALREVKEFFISLRLGAKIIFSSRKFSWLLAGYTLPLILHRLIENVIFPTYAKHVLKDGSLSGILLGASNFGELCGALFVLVVGQVIPTPLPFVRFDGAALSILWVFAFSHPTSGMTFALCLAPFLVFVSAGWAAGDVSLLAYIQSQLAQDYGDHAIDGVSPLGAVMSFLYSSYIIMYTVVSVCVGHIFDYYFNRNDPSMAFLWISGVFMSMCGIIIVASSFIPPGSWHINPKPQA